MRIGIDLDSTICTDRYKSGGVLKCKVLPGAKEKIDKLRAAGHTVIIYTHRGYDLEHDTALWLKNNNIVIDYLICGKPYFDVYIGNEARQFKNWKDIDIDTFY